jgi:hypothetical protein
MSNTCAASTHAITAAPTVLSSCEAFVQVTGSRTLSVKREDIDRVRLPARAG